MAASSLIQFKRSLNVNKWHLFSLPTPITRAIRLPPVIKVIVLPWLALVFTALSPTSSLAWTSSGHAEDLTFDRVAPAALTVISRNQEYTELLNGRVVQLRANFGIAANGDGVPLDHASIKFRVMSSSSDRAALEYPLEWVKRYSGSNQDRDRDSAAVNIPRDVIAQFAIKECNREKERMLGMGNRAVDIFAIDRRLPLIISLTGEWGHKAFQGDNVEMHSFPSTERLAAMEIVCAADTSFNVKRTTIQIRPVTRADGTCEIAAQVGISTTHPNQPLAYTLENHLGRHSTVYRVVTDRNGNAIGNHKLKVENKAGLETGRLHVVGFEPKYFISNVVNYSINCPVGHGLKSKNLGVTSPRGIPGIETLKPVGTIPSSDVPQSKKPNVPGIKPPPGIPQNNLLKK
ncbi:hypothetical protein [Sedimenticola selenatireducens]|uniref:Uncharacterized protein n=1 Tax=Sedimenticola selenatireducens TaxID=191960 RepID=A0A557SEN9_9GAMM|nr:hypothetical protein [Sedimenticola selenatireducens]TVO75843.1 hypothetical protein FHP88_07540 [Sedimenticola selenatireducens]TVT63702.1 MAG: hypothetical protein FHK78_10240 [Sedimenticola selenatireducens]